MGIQNCRRQFCSRRRLLRRGLEFYECTINKSFPYEKSLETYRMHLVYYNILYYWYWAQLNINVTNYIYIYICVCVCVCGLIKSPEKIRWLFFISWTVAIVTANWLKSQNRTLFSHVWRQGRLALDPLWNKSSFRVFLSGI